MKPLPFLLALCASALAATSELIDSTTISIQPISASSQPVISLAEISFNPSTLKAAISSFESPELPEDAKLLRVGIYDAATSKWKSSTSMTSAENFAKGYRPTIVLNLGAEGEVIGVSVKSSTIDAGQTRDFAPKVLLRKMQPGKRPDLNRPIVLKEGKLEEPEPEKSFLQKYWWAILPAVLLLMTGGGGD